MAGKRMPVANHLTDEEYKTLLTVYANHNSSMGFKERGNYTLSNIVKVERNPKENCLNVYYDNGTCFHYFPDGSWH